jgi:proteasome lid subunit RPN8/RPN11
MRPVGFAVLKIQNNVLDLLFRHATRELPFEACGYLAEQNGIIMIHYEMANTDQAADHFSMDPAEQFAVMKDIRNRDMKLRAVYHSHPETSPRPSAEDIRLAYDPHISYVIIGLAGGDRSVKTYRIRKGRVDQEDLEIVR